MQIKKSTIVVYNVIFIGLVLLIYPTLSNWWNTRTQSMAIGGYIKQQEEISKEDYKSMIKEAKKYNEQLIGRSNNRFIFNEEDRKEYEKLLKLSGSEIMSILEVPKINIRLPIYHGTDEAVLQVALGHIEGTSLPIGGKGSHAAISGHTGLKSARLFTDLDKLTKGDIFTISTLNQTMTYEVDKIQVVLPMEMDGLMIEENQDYVTLQTCTPYGINTHRLLVRGVRINTNEKDTKIFSDLLEINKFFILLLFTILALFILVLIGIIRKIYLRKK